MQKPVKRYSIIATLILLASMLLAACGETANNQPAATVTTGGTVETPAAGVGATATTAAGGAGGEATATQAPSTGGTGNTGKGPTLKDPNTLVEGQAGEPETLDPAYAYDTSSSSVIIQVYETLLFPNREKASEFVPMLATKWDISPDGKTYTFTIRKGVKFHDGQDLTPEDVAYSLQRGMIQDRASGPQWIMLQPFFGLDVQSFKGDVVDKANNKNFVQGCQAVQQAVTFDNNAGTVTMHLKQPYGPMLQILTGTWAAVVSKQYVASKGGWDGNCADAEKYHDPKAEQDELFQQMNGTGPFKFDRWNHGDQISLVRNDNYWLTEPLWTGGPSGPAKLQRVTIKYINEWGTRFAAFQAGDLDINYVDQQYVSQVDPFVKETCMGGESTNCTQTNANGYLRLFKGLPTSSDSAIFFNQAVNTTGGNNRIGSGKLDGNGIPPDFFSDIHIRKAFNNSFDWDTYIKQLYNGEAEQALGPIINGLLGYDPNQAKYSLNLDQATNEFKQSTIKSADGKSVWDTGFKIQYVYNEGNDQRKTAGEILKDNLSRINPKFQIDVQSEPWPSFLKETSDGRLGLFMLGWQEDFHDPHDWVFPFLSSGGTYSGSQHFPKDLQTQLDNLINQAVASTDNNQRASLYKQLQNLSYENALDMFIVQPQAREYMQTWVKGWYYNPIYPAGTNTGEYFYVLSKGQ